MKRPSIKSTAVIFALVLGAVPVSAIATETDQGTAAVMDPSYTKKADNTVLTQEAREVASAPRSKGLPALSVFRK